MIENVDYRKYLSIDNGKGLLINKNDAFILEQYGFDYYNCSSISDLMLIINRFIDDNEISELDDLEDVISHLMEVHYYNETKK